MCSRFVLKRLPAWLKAELAVDEWPDEASYLPHFNIAPTAVTPVLRELQGRRQMHGLRWGLLPHWAKDPGLGAKTINARAETLTEKPAFRNLVARHRCLVVADGYYEWQHRDGNKLPHYIARADGWLALLAGLWDTWTTPAGQARETFTVITVPAVPALASVHDRMPVLLDRAQLEIWLHAAPEAALALLRPYPGELAVYPVSAAVNSPRHDGPELLQAVASQPALFPE